MDKISLNKYSAKSDKSLLIDGYNALKRTISHSFIHSNLISTNSRQATTKTSKRGRGIIENTKDRSLIGQGGQGKSGKGIARIVSSIGDIADPKSANIYTAPLLFGAIVKYVEQHPNIKGLIGTKLLTPKKAEDVARQLPRDVFISVDWFSKCMLKKDELPRKIYDGMEKACDDLQRMQYREDLANGDILTVTVFDSNTKHRSTRNGVTLTFSTSFIQHAIVQGWYTRIHLEHIFVGTKDGKEFALTSALSSHFREISTLTSYLENGGYINLKMPTVLEWIGDLPLITESGEGDTLGDGQSVIEKVLLPLKKLLDSFEGRGISANILESNAVDALPVLDDNGKFAIKGKRCTRKDVLGYIVRFQLSPEWIKDLIEDRNPKEREKLVALFLANRILENTKGLITKRLP